MQTPSAIRIAPLIAACMLAACNTLSVPQEHFYTLNPPVPQQAAPDRNTTAAYSVTVGPVRVPELVDRPQMVVRRGANQVDVLEQHRWAQPLPAEITQALATALAARLPQARIVLDRETGSTQADYRVTLDVKRFEAVLGEAATVQSSWTIQPNAAKAAPRVGQSTVQMPAGGADYDALAAAFSSAVRQTGNDIAGAIASMRRAGAPPVK